MKQILGLETAQRTIRTAGEYWDVRLTPTKEKPFPLAPVGFNMNAETYRKENIAWGRFVSEVMHYESIGPTCILGFGLGRDCEWVRSKLGETGQNRVSIVDYSSVACDNAKEFLKKNGILRRVNVNQIEIMEGWNSGRIRDEEVNVYFMSQFLEHLGRSMNDFMHHLGNFLKTSGKIVYLITPRKEDNPETVLWDHARPLWESQWRVELDEGLGESAEVERLGKHKYFDRVYSFLKLYKTTT